MYFHKIKKISPCDISNSPNSSEKTIYCVLPPNSPVGDYLSNPAESGHLSSYSENINIYITNNEKSESYSEFSDKILSIIKTPELQLNKPYKCFIFIHLGHKGFIIDNIDKNNVNIFESLLYDVIDEIDNKHDEVNISSLSTKYKVLNFIYLNKELFSIAIKAIESLSSAIKNITKT